MGLIKQPFGEPLLEKSGEGSGLVTPARVFQERE